MKPRTVKIAFRTVVIKKMTKRQYLAYYRKEFARMGVPFDRHAHSLDFDSIFLNQNTKDKP